MLVKEVKVSLLAPSLVGYMLLSMTEFTTGVFFLDYIRDFNITNTEAGAIFSIFIAFSAITTFPGGNLSDRIGTKSVMIVGLGLFFLSFILVSFSFIYLILLIAYAMAGIGKGCFSASLFTYIGGLLPKSRGFVVGLATSFFYFGGFVGPWLLGYLASQYGWRFPLRLMGLVGIVVVILQYVSIKAPKTEMAQVSTGVSYRRIFTIRNMIIAIVAVFGAGFGFGANISWTPTFLRSFQSLDITSAGLVFGVFSLGGLIGSSAFGYLSDRIGPKSLVVTTGILSSPIAYVFFAYQSPLILLLILAFAFGFLAAPYWSLMIALVQESVPSEAAGTATGTIQGTTYTASVIAPLAVAGLTFTFGISQAMIYASSFTFLIYGIINIAAKGRYSQRQ